MANNEYAVKYVKIETPKRITISVVIKMEQFDFTMP